MTHLTSIQITLKKLGINKFDLAKYVQFSKSTFIIVTLGKYYQRGLNCSASSYSKNLALFVEFGTYKKIGT